MLRTRGGGSDFSVEIQKIRALQVKCAGRWEKDRQTKGPARAGDEKCDPQDSQLDGALGPKW